MCHMIWQNPKAISKIAKFSATVNKVGFDNFNPSVDLISRHSYQGDSFLTMTPSIVIIYSGNDILVKDI